MGAAQGGESDDVCQLDRAIWPRQHRSPAADSRRRDVQPAHEQRVAGPGMGPREHKGGREAGPEGDALQRRCRTWRALLRAETCL